MAGGSGTRLWPLSTSNNPKQFISMPDQKDSHKKPKTFFATAVERALAVTDSLSCRVIIIAGKKHINSIMEECAVLSTALKKRLIIIPEPIAKNTAPAIACALSYINLVSAGEKRNILVITSDHIINPLNIFKKDCITAAAAAMEDKLVVFGISPHGPETGYGYIETAKSPAKNSKNEQCKEKVYSVKSFREKPDIKTAKSFIAAKNFYWNSGMFAFSSGFLLEEFKNSSLDVIAPFTSLSIPPKKSYQLIKGIKILNNWENLEAAYKKTKAISIDYAIAEKCKNVAMVKAGFSWTDVGCWDEYVRLAEHSNAEVYGTAEALETSYVNSDIPVALCGIKDLIVVARSGKNGGPAVVLISKKGETQKIKEIVEQIKINKREELL